MREQRQNQRGSKVCIPLHAPEVERIGKGKRIALTQSASRFPAASSSPTPRRCRAILTTATRWRRSSQRSRRRSAPADPHRRRSRLSRPQRAARPSLQGLYLRPETTRHRAHRARAASPPGCRAGHRPRQRRASHGPPSTSPANRAMRPTPSSPPRDTTSEDCWPGSKLWLSAFLFAMGETYGIKKSGRRRLIHVLHGRLDQQPISTKPLANGAGHTFFNLWSEVASGPSAIDTRSGFRAAAWRSPRVGPPRLRLLSRDP